MTEESDASHPDPEGLSGVLNDESLISSSDTLEILEDIPQNDASDSPLISSINDDSLISSSDTLEILEDIPQNDASEILEDIPQKYDILTEKRYYVYQNPHTFQMEALIPCVNNEAEILKDLPKVDGQPVPYKIVDQLPQKYFESYDLAAEGDNALLDNAASSPFIQSRAKLHSLKKSEWRQLRTIQFSKYDVSFMRALEDGNTAEIDRIKSIKQQLRDVTAADVSSLTNQELEDFTPDILK